MKKNFAKTLKFIKLEKKSNRLFADIGWLEYGNVFLTGIEKLRKNGCGTSDFFENIQMRQKLELALLIYSQFAVVNRA